jgi:hypothetical protein
MIKPKIFELKIEEDDELSGIDSISLVDEPAIEVNWIAFNKQKEHEFHIPDGEDELYLEKLMKYGQSEQELLDEGFEFDRILDERDEFISTDPNGESRDDTNYYRVRYRYGLSPNIAQNPIIPTTRAFCRDLVNKNYVWRDEDIEAITNDFGDSARLWRGGYNCRHRWFRILYKASGTIINKSSINKDKITGPEGVPVYGTPDFLQPNTVTGPTLANPSPSTVRNLGLSKQDFEVGVAHYTKDGKLYEGPTHKDAEGRLMTGAVHTEDSEYLYHEGEFESVSDYPDSVKNNAKAVLKYVEENGWGDCGTDVGKQRANQLANGEPISLDTVQRMYSYLSRHKVDLDSSTGYGDGCGKLMYDSWGGLSALSWAESKLNSFDKQNFAKISLDYDGTLSKLEGRLLAKRLVGQGNDVYVVTARQDSQSAEVYRIAKEVGIPRGNVYFTNGRPKSPKLKSLGISKHYDNNPDVIKEIETNTKGIQAVKFDYNVGGIGGYVDPSLKKKVIPKPLVTGGTTTMVNKFQEEFEYLFTKQQEKQHFQIDSEEKRIVLGPAMIPDQKIFRKDALGNPYYVFFSSETIKMIAEKYMRNKYLDNNDQMHDGTAVKDVYVIESWIKEDMNDKSNKYGYSDLPVGTWFVSMKVKNIEIWNKVKENKLNGFSVSGFFEEVASFCREEMFLSELAKLLKEVKE